MWKFTIAVCINVAFLMVSPHLQGQSRPDTTKTNPSLELNGLFGFFIANQPKSLYLRNDHSRMLELAISLPTSGRKDWERQSNFPRIGLGVLYGGLGSEQYLGNMLAVYPFIHFPLL